MKNTKRKRMLSELLLVIFMFGTSLTATVFVSHLKLLTLDEMIKNIVITIFLTFAVYAGYIISYEKNGLLYDNAKHRGRFLFFYLCGLLFGAITLYLPVKIFPFVFLAVALSLTSNGVIGMTAYMTTLFITTLCGNHEESFFYLYAITGLIAITLFKDIDYKFHYTGLLVATVGSLFVCETAFGILFDEQMLSLDAFVFPMINALLNCILLLVLLKYYSKRIVHIYRDKYQEINDPEYIILSDLKKLDAKTYYHVVHTAYFSDKIAKRIGANEYLAKALGYYGKCEAFGAEADVSYSISVMEDLKFPPELLEGFKQLHEPVCKIEKREAVIAFMADAVVSSISFFFEKDKNAELDYRKVIDLIFKKKLESGVLDLCELTCKEIDSMKNLFIEENLYYDFLR